MDAAPRHNSARSPTATSRWNWSASPRPPPSPPPAGSVSARRTKPTAPRSRRCARHSTQVAIDGTVVIGEGEMDEAPMLYHRREGRRRRAADGHRGRSAGGHDADRQGRTQRDRHRGAGRARQLPARARHLHGQDRRRRRPAGGRGGPRRSGRRRTCETWRGRRSARWPTWSPASSIATGTRN